MKREIRFRAWNGKEMIMPDYPFIGSGSDAREICIRIDGQTRIPNAYGLEGSTTGAPRPEIPELVFMQYTGKKDDKEKEIFEADIVKFRVHPRKTQIGHIQYIPHQTRFYIIHGDRLVEWTNLSSCNTIEVIGNIFTHPQLLEHD